MSSALLALMLTACIPSDSPTLMAGDTAALARSGRAAAGGTAGLDTQTPAPAPDHAAVPPDTCTYTETGHRYEGCLLLDAQGCACDDWMCQPVEQVAGLCQREAGSTCHHGVVAEVYDSCFLLSVDGCACDDGECSPADAAAGRCNPHWEGCVQHPGWWRDNHAKTTDTGPPIPWPVAEDTDLCGETWLQHLQQQPGSDKRYALTRPYIAAKLNIAQGAAAPSHVEQAVSDAEAMLADCTISSAELASAGSIAGLLAAYDSGTAGPTTCAPSARLSPLTGDSGCLHDQPDTWYGTCILQSLAGCVCDDEVCSPTEEAAGACRAHTDEDGEVDIDIDDQPGGGDELMDLLYGPTWSAANEHGQEGAAIYGTFPSEAIGTVLAIGDYDGDGFDDLAIGAPDAQGGRGRTYVMPGGAYGTDVPPAAGTAPWSYPLAVDATMHDWLSTVSLPTSAGRPAAVTWDASSLYLGATSPNIAFGGAASKLVVYLADDDADGSSVSLAFGAQQSTLPFLADHALVWRADGFGAKLYTWTGTSWSAAPLETTDVSWAVSTAEQVVEFGLPWSILGYHDRFQLLSYWVYDAGVFSYSSSALPAGAFTDGTWDPDPTAWYVFDRTSTASPAAHAPMPGGGPPTLADESVTWWPDLDLDRWGDLDDEHHTCPMHVPMDPDLDGRILIRAVFTEPTADDCDDQDAWTYPGALDPEGDGIDQDCSEAAP